MLLPIVTLSLLCLHPLGAWAEARQDLATSKRLSFADIYRSRSLKAVDWCTLKCKDKEHVACPLKGVCSPAADPCKFLSPPKQLILDTHNELRNKFATGNEPKSGGLQVADMIALQWDDDLAFTAQCNLVACPAEMAHDQCHITEKFKTSGQNIAWGKGNLDCIRNTKHMIWKWYNEVNKMSASEIKQQGIAYTHPPETGHFTQAVWAKVTHIGCALTIKTDEDKKTHCMMTCNYGPAGNVKGGSMFTEGSPASACPEGLYATSKYPGLCGIDGANAFKASNLIVLVLTVLLVITIQ